MLGRVTRSPDIRRIFADGLRASRGPLTVIGLATGPTHPDSRVGVIVGRRFGGAVQRNRIKRRLRVLLRTHTEAIPLGWDVLVLPRTSAQQWTFGALSDAFDTLLTAWRRDLDAGSRPPGPSP